MKDLFLLLTSLGCVSASLPFPQLPRQYSATVSANFLELGYTLAYNEFYDANSSTLFTEGRFGDLQTFALVNYKTQLISEWKFQDACYTTRFSQLSAPVFGPSIQEFFSEQDYDAPNRTFDYLGEVRGQTETRGILCNKWREAFVLTRNTSTTSIFTNATVDYYFAANTSFLTRKRRGSVPVRVWSTGTTRTTTSRTGVSVTTPFEHVYDWVDWTNGAPSFVFQPPANCKPTTNSALIYGEEVPKRSLVVNTTSNSSSPTIPVTPENFRMLLEVKLVEKNTTSDVLTMNWWRNRRDFAERIDIQPEADKDPTSLLYVYQTPLLWDGLGLVYNNSGSQCFKLAAYDGNNCVSRSCTTAKLSHNTSSPLNMIREGGFVDFWDDGTWFKNAIYQGRQLARGVNADVWMKFRTRSSALDETKIYTYQQYVYYYPKGWQWPGRNVSAGGTFPMRMRIEGTISCLEDSTTCTSHEPVQFSDLYDIFEFIPGIPPSSSLQPPCPQASCWDGIQNQGEAGIDCGMPACPNPCPVAQGTLPFPKLSKYYITSVSANIINKNYTLSFNEFYDATCGDNKGCLLTEGHFADLRQLELVDFKKNTVSRWMPDSPCVSAQHSKLPGDHAGSKGPSVSFFQSASVNAKYSYYGKIKSTPETRGILCDKWTTFTSTTTNRVETNVSIAYYFASNTTTTQGAIPVRVWIKGSNTDFKQQATLRKPVLFEHVYDWTDWQNVKPPAFVFTPPEKCPITTNYSLFDEDFIATGTLAAEAPAGSLAVPSLSSTFRMVVEVKLSQGNTVSKLWSANWWLGDKKERLDLQPQGSLGSSTLYYDYKSSALWDGSGTMDNVTGLNCYKIAFDNLNRCSSSTCLSKVPLSAKTANPLLSFRDGSFVKLFAPNSRFFEGAEYVGRKSARGINADVWMKSQTNRTVGKTLYSYYQYMYFFPQGWQFPGRPMNDSVPLRVINDGQMTNATSGEIVFFNDVFDIFQFRSGKPPSVVFVGKCAEPLSDFDQFVASINNPIGKILGGIVVALLLIICIVAVVHCVRKRRAVPKSTPEMELN